jgi:hypothetical protein
MLDYKPNDYAHLQPTAIQSSDKPVKQTKFVESSHPIRDDAKHKASGIAKSIFTGIAGTRLG